MGGCGSKQSKAAAPESRPAAVPATGPTLLESTARIVDKEQGKKDGAPRPSAAPVPTLAAVPQLATPLVAELELEPAAGPVEAALGRVEDEAVVPPAEALAVSGSRPVDRSLPSWQRMADALSGKWEGLERREETAAAAAGPAPPLPAELSVRSEAPDELYESGTPRQAPGLFHSCCGHALSRRPRASAA